MLLRKLDASTISPDQLWNIYNSGRVIEVNLVELAKRYRTVLLLAASFSLGAAAMFISMGASTMVEPLRLEPNAAAVLMLDEPEKPEISKENLYQEIIKNEILCPEVVLAQGQLESALLQAGNSYKTNNLFGMRYPSVRPTTAIGIYLQGKDSIIYGTQDELRKYLKHPTYAVYDHWTESVKDYKLWQDFSFKTRAKYIDFLSRVYATSPTYAREIKKMVK